MRIAVFSYGLPVRGRSAAVSSVRRMCWRRVSPSEGHPVVVFSHDPAPAGAVYEVRELPWRAFVDTWLGRRVTMGYLGNVLALLPDYRGFDAHRRPRRQPAAAAPRQARVRVHARQRYRGGDACQRHRAGFVLQCGVYVQELLTALTTSGTVAVSRQHAARQSVHPSHIPHGVDTRVF